ncbi:hypothetical protein [Bdellovibrio svalbardensis]|uniref:Uncharacterized protein n=1 Tax=Bdellovibrio svalbardensis TaxID=2972972 RepID=A0ABT6DJ02_9BACT|nr:hypothetical protein [Bdellovibrio svalbardensis]MDG0816848.1 hypothetical protein [Bdellovibrio svalbardensis]
MRIALAALATFFLVLLSQTGLAHAETELPQCSMTSEGIFNGSWVKHRIVSGEEVLFGANQMESIFSQLDSLRAKGLCR